MGLLGAAERAPFLVLGLFAGVWVDRLRRRPILIAADVGRAALLASIPLAAVFGMLRIEQLYAVGFFVGCLTVFFDVASLSFLPSLVQRSALVHANSVLEVRRSIVQIAGPSVAGFLVQLVSAPVAIIVDALSFVGSAVALTLIRMPEPPPTPRAQRRSVWNEVGEGLGVVLRDPLLRSIAASSGTFNIFTNVLFAVYVLYATRELGIAPALLGVIFLVFGLGGLAGAVLARRIQSQIGLGPTLGGIGLVDGVATLLVPLAAAFPLITVPLLMAAQAVLGFGAAVYKVNQKSLRQAITQERMQGRVNATMRFITWGTMPIGSLLGGVLGELIGLRPTLIVAALGMMLAALILLVSPVRALRDQPPQAPVAS